MKFKQNKKTLYIILAIFLAIAAGVGYYHKSQLNNPCSSSYQGAECCHGLCTGGHNSDIYYDSNGCAHSRSGKIAPTYCVKQ